MKDLLVLSPWFPYPPDNGSRIRIYHLLRELSKRFRIRLVAGVQSDSPIDIPPPLALLCHEVQRAPWVWHDGDKGGPLSAARALLSPIPRSILETRNATLDGMIAAQLQRPTDAVLVCELGMDAYLPTLPPTLPAILEGAEVSGMERTAGNASGQAARLRAGLTAYKGTRYWGQRFQRYHSVTAVSEGEAGAIRRTLVSPSPPVVVIPNGVDCASYPRREANAVIPGRMIYNGALTYGPNRDAVRYLKWEILPRIAHRVPEAHLVVTGRFTDESIAGISPSERVQLTGFLPDIRPTLASAAVCVVPLSTGGGTRLKILEAWAAGVPVVSTPIGAAGLAGAQSGEHLMIADTTSGLTDDIAAILTDPELSDRLSRNARRLAENSYDWTMIGATLGDLLEQATISDGMA